MVPHLDWTSNTKVMLKALQKVIDFTLAPTILSLVLGQLSIPLFKAYKTIFTFLQNLLMKAKKLINK